MSNIINPYRFAAAGGEPDIEVLYDSTTIPDGGSHTISPNPEEGVEYTEVFTIENNGTATLTLSAASISNTSNVTVNSHTFGAVSVAPSGSTTWTVKYTATNDGAFSWDVEIPSNDPDTATYDFSVDGTADAAVNPPTSIDLLLVAGGGGGAGNAYGGGSGGGGAGGMRDLTGQSINPSGGETYTAVVGVGGGGGSSDFSGAGSPDAESGGESKFYDSTETYSESSAGGGQGGRYVEFDSASGGDGGSGGGAGYYDYMTSGAATGGAATPSGQGNAGGDSRGVNPWGAAGGGGAYGPGGSDTADNGGDGGTAASSTITGTAVDYAGGGGGGAGYQKPGGDGGTDAGDGGFGYTTDTSAANAGGGNGTANLGGGGGGGGRDNDAGTGTGGSGGKGVVIISYDDSYDDASSTDGTKTSVGGKTIYTFNDTGAITWD